MKIGVPKEVKTEEYRVAVTPSGVKELVKRGHTVYVQRSAGEFCRRCLCRSRGGTA